MWKFYRRNRGLVTAASLLAVMLVIAVAGTTTGWIQAMLVSRQLEEKAGELAQQGEELREQKDVALAGQQREHDLREQAESERTIADTERNKAERSLYMAQMQLAYHAMSRPHAGTVEATLERWMPEPGRPDHRGWEWYYLLAESRKDMVWTLHDHIRPVRNVAWSQDNVRFASIGDDGVARIWDVRTGRQLAQLPKTDSGPCTLCWSSDGNTIATGHHDGKIQLWDGASYAAKGQLAGHKTVPPGYPASRQLASPRTGNAWHPMDGTNRSTSGTCSTSS